MPKLSPTLKNGCLRILSGAILAISITGCGIARSAGSNLAAGAIARLNAEDTILVALERRLSDSVGVFLRQEFAGAVLNPARATWNDMSQSVRGEADSVSARLANQIRTDINSSVQQLLRDNLSVLEQGGSQTTRTISEALTDALSHGLTTRMAAAGDTLTTRFASALARSLDEILRPALHSVMLDLRDSLQVRIGDVDRTVAESRTVSGVRQTLFGAGAAVILAIAFATIGHWRRQRKALHALIDAVDAAGDDGVKQAVQTCAQEVGVHGWLTDRVASRRKETCK